MATLKQDTIDYMDSVWGFSQAGTVDDIAMFWDTGHYEMVALRLVDAGAVEPNCTQARNMIAVARSLSRKYQLECIDDATKGYETYQCSECNYIHYLDTTWVEPNDWISGGCQGCNRENTVSKMPNRRTSKAKGPKQ